MPHIPILGHTTRPADGVAIVPTELVDTTDLYPRLLYGFPDSGTKIGISGAFRVPDDYDGGAAIVVVWRTAETSGDVVFDVDYTAVAEGESLDPSSHQESVSETDSAPGTAHLRADTTLALTASNFAPGDVVLFTVSRDGADAADDLAGVVLLEGVYFSYTVAS